MTIAVAVPCFNEVVTIAKVVRDFKAVLPEATVHVFDNNSTDGSAAAAAAAGAVVHRVGRQGKGHVMRAILDTIRVDALVVVDGDDTYLAEDAPALLGPILRREADMAVGNRLHQISPGSLRQLHQVGNRLIVGGINLMFRTSCRDILSGYRVFSRRFVDTVPILTPGFETETELTLRALTEELVITEIPISYRSRPAGSESKLRSFHDGYRIMLTAVILLRDLHPLRLFGSVSVLCTLVALTGLVLRVLTYNGMETLPASALAAVVLLFAPLGILTFGIGLILNAINTRYRETHQLLNRGKRRGERDV